MSMTSQGFPGLKVATYDIKGLRRNTLGTQMLGKHIILEMLVMGQEITTLMPQIFPGESLQL